MPVSPSPNFLQQFGMQQPQVGPSSGMQGPMPVAQPLLPSWMKTGFEGGMDGIMGLLGLGDGNSKMNQVGQLGAAAIPMFGSGIGLASRIKPVMQAAPEAGEVGNLISQMSNNLRKIPGGQNPLYDDAGRFLAMESPMQETRPGFTLPPQMMDVSGPRHIPSVPNDTAFNAHVESARNKNVIPPKGAGHQNLVPNNNQLEALMAKYKK